jgi:hypothetical protein
MRQLLDLNSATQRSGLGIQRNQRSPRHVRHPRWTLGDRNFLELARSLKLGVIAEGVETEQQLFRLRKLGCAYFQVSSSQNQSTPRQLSASTDKLAIAVSPPLHPKRDRPADSKQPLLLTKPWHHRFRGFPVYFRALQRAPGRQIFVMADP